MKDISIRPITEYGYGFVKPEYMEGDEDEYLFRNRQVSAEKRGWRRLKTAELEILVKNNNTCVDWDDFLVSDPFDPSLILNSNFAGLVRIGKMSPAVLRHHDFILPIGIRNSTIIACDIGDNCAIQDCGYISHYIMENAVILYNVDEMHTTDHAKFGNGIIKDGEDEAIRIWIDVMNEAGGRSILPFNGMICADAYLWAAYRDDKKLCEALKEITQKNFGGDRGAYGYVGEYSVIKSVRVVKDVNIGEYAYIKGANKLKNLTINSSENEKTQIGEGVELVNGIIDYGCHIFYGCKAVRFVMGRNSSLKYGARLIHSVLGDNSTVSCCEILNNLIFPAHEQHHNNSFLIASMIQGLSNIAAGATIGSNHNSRAPDGEIRAGRGFWPGLCVTLKHSCRFASYILIAKGDYSAEMNIWLPFTLVNNNVHLNRLELMPAYFWMHNMYALERNAWKAHARDKRPIKVQRIEADYLAPDTVEEIINAMDSIAYWTGKAAITAQGGNVEYSRNALSDFGAQLLSSTPEATRSLQIVGEGLENDPRPTLILKAHSAWRAYREMLLWYVARSLLSAWEDLGSTDFASFAAAFASVSARQTEWVNLGGQLVAAPRVNALRAEIGEGKLSSWEEIHKAYNAFDNSYPLDRASHAWSVLRLLLAIDRRYPDSVADAPSLKSEALPPPFSTVADQTAFPSPDQASLAARLEAAVALRHWIGDQVYRSRAKDYENSFRAATYRNRDEMEAVLGSMADNSFVKAAKQATQDFKARANKILALL